ncbi:GDSL esterase/lipase At5g55050-like [Phragmites australis]|uniref:GDSL esterase/lipase At5g55050-like n=1 Tax=Phragmites australis TaxID=29695 RepID=UPI002D775784|nr:GDSL esterase/lipase At5g55050-like [Phragmites australis]
MAVQRGALLRVLLVAVAAIGAAAAKVPAMFVFGDSTADVGNNDYLPWTIARANFPHNGVDFPGGKPTGRFSNGLIGVDFLAFDMGFSRSPPPYLSFMAIAANNISSEMMKNKTMAASAYMTGANFASGGSGVLDSTGTTISMTKQIEYFSDLKDQISTRLGAGRVSALLSKSIFLISAGGNDAFDFFTQNRSPDSTTLQQFSDAVISTYDSHVKTLYNSGARKFAVINVPLIGCCPYCRRQNPTGECIEPLNKLAKSLNDGIKDLFSNLSTEMQGMKYSIASSYELVSSLIENPQAAGLEEVKSACCGGGRLNAEEGCTPNSSCCSDRSKYLFWDLLHPTQATSKFAGLAFYDGPAQLVSPITFKQLVEA